MMKRLRRWLMSKYLPAWAKDAAAEEIAHLHGQIDELKKENERLRSFIEGYEAGVKAHRRIIINAGSVNGEAVK